MKRPRTPAPSGSAIAMAAAAARKPDEPALVDTAPPQPAVTGGTSIAGADPVAGGGVLPAGAATAPAVPDSIPLPSDQSSVAQRPIDTVTVPIGAREMVAGDIMGGDPAMPSVVPVHRSIEELTPPAASPAPATTGAVFERVPGTVPLPSDQITPLAPATTAAAERISPAITEAIEDAIALDDKLYGERRLFPVAYDVEHDGVLYVPGSEPVALTWTEHERLFGGAVLIDWFDGQDVRA